MSNKTRLVMSMRLQVERGFDTWNVTTFLGEKDNISTAGCIEDDTFYMSPPRYASASSRRESARYAVSRGGVMKAAEDQW